MISKLQIREQNITHTLKLAKTSKQVNDTIQ